MNNCAMVELVDQNFGYGIMSMAVSDTVQNISPLTVKNSLTVGKLIEKFLNRDVAQGTLNNYRFDIVDFFGCEIMDITLESVLAVSVMDAEDYKEKLINDGYNLGTVKEKLSRLKAMYTYLINQTTDNSHRVKVFTGNPFAGISVNVKGRYRTEDNKVSKYGDFTRHEVSALMNVTRDPLKLFYEMATRTAVRKSALLNLKFEDVIMVNGVWCISVDHDKTVDNILEAITDEMYEKIKDYTGCVDGAKIFDIDGSTINRNLVKDCEKIGISKEEQKRRRLCVHSFKKASVNMIKEVTNGDLEAMKNKAHHKDINLTINTYVSKSYDSIGEKSLQFDLGYGKVEDELSDKLKDMAAWELRELILSMNGNVRKSILEKVNKDNRANNDMVI